MNHDQVGRIRGMNRFGEENIHAATYEDEGGMRHPTDWSRDPRSESASEHHYGKGPRNYKKSDERIHDDACRALMDSISLDASEIEVAVEDGVVRLTGQVHSRMEKLLAEKIVDEVSGVFDIINQLHFSGSRIPEGNAPGGLIKGLT